MIKNKAIKKRYNLLQAAHALSFAIGMICSKNPLLMIIAYEVSILTIAYSHTCPLKIMAQFSPKDFLRASRLLYKNRFIPVIILYSIYPITLIYCLINHSK